MTYDSELYKTLKSHKYKESGYDKARVENPESLV